MTLPAREAAIEPARGGHVGTAGDGRVAWTGHRRVERADQRADEGGQVSIAHTVCPVTDDVVVVKNAHAVVPSRQTSQ